MICSPSFRVLRKSPRLMGLILSPHYSTYLNGSDSMLPSSGHSLTRSSATEPARTAYITAKQYFSSHLTQDESKRVWLAEKSTMQDVITAVQIARSKYEERSKKSKVRESLAAFSSRVMYYGAVMDTLSQHHPEYVALAWGSMKLSFVVSLVSFTLISSPKHYECLIADGSN